MKKGLPKNWVETTIGDVGDIVTGNTPSKKCQEYYGDDFPWVKPGDVNDAITITSTSEYLSLLGSQKARMLPKGTVMVTCIGNLGNIAIAGTELSTNQQINSIIFCDGVSSKYGYYWCNTLKGWLVENSTSTTISMVNKSIFSRAPFLLPPLPEQKRIVAKLDQLFASLEEVKTRMEQFKNTSSKFTYACLIDPEKRQYYPRKKIGDYLEEGTQRIGESWNKYRLIGVSAKEGITDLRVGQKASFENYKIVKPGDFIYNTMRVNIGSIAIYQGKEIALTSPDYVVFRVKKHLSSHLLLQFLKSEQGLLEIGSNTKGSVRARLYFSALSNVRIPLGPASIHTFAEKFLVKFESSLQKLKKFESIHLETLPQTILAKAFRGELVEQLPTDGDARELLKEIAQLKVGAKRAMGKGQGKLNRKKQIVNKNFPLEAILLETGRTMSESELLTISKMSLHSFVRQLDKEISEERIISSGSPAYLKVKNIP